MSVSKKYSDPNGTVYIDMFDGPEEEAAWNQNAASIGFPRTEGDA